MESQDLNNDTEKKRRESMPPPKKNSRIVTMDSIRNSSEDPERQAYFAGGSEHSGQQILGRGKRKSGQESSDAEESGEALAEAFRRASALNAGQPSRSVSYYPEPQSFTGAGHRLGDTSERSSSKESTFVNAENSDASTPTNVVVTLWENGFNIDDGPLKSYTDLSCAELMNNIDRGEFPTTLVHYDRSPVHLSVVDKRKETFKDAVKVFGGKGHILGSPTPLLTSTPDPPSPSRDVSTRDFPSSPIDICFEHMEQSSSSSGSSVVDSFRKTKDSLDLLRRRMPTYDEEFTPEEVIFEDDESNGSSGPEFFQNANDSLKVFGGKGHTLQGSTSSDSSLTDNNISSRRISDEPQEAGHPSSSSLDYKINNNADYSDSKRTTMLKIRLPDGQIVQLTVNSSCSISQLKEFIRQCVPALTGSDFVLQLTYPRRDLLNEETLDAGDMKNTVLVLRHF